MLNESTARKIEKELSSYKRLVFSYLVLLVSMAIISSVWEKDTKEQQRLEQLRQIAAETPVHPDFRELDSNSVMKKSHVVFSVYYDVRDYPASFDEVKKFYMEALTAKGWSFEGEHIYGGNSIEVLFRKGEYSISIFYSEGRAEGWEYSISYGW